MSHFGQVDAGQLALARVAGAMLARPGLGRAPIPGLGRIPRNGQLGFGDLLDLGRGSKSESVIPQ